MDEVTYDVDGHMATITLNRPDKLNAMTDEMYHGIGAALGEADADPAVRCMIVTGTGRAFTSGHDLGEFADRTAWMPWRPDRFDVGLETAKPTIAAVQGYCLAGGLELALFCDIRVCDNTGAVRLPGGALGRSCTATGRYGCPV